jgi:hypothetical protein
MTLCLGLAAAFLVTASPDANAKPADPDTTTEKQPTDPRGHACQCGKTCHCGHCSGVVPGCHCHVKRADGKE